MFADRLGACLSRTSKNSSQERQKWPLLVAFATIMVVASGTLGHVGQAQSDGPALADEEGDVEKAYLDILQGDVSDDGTVLNAWLEVSDLSLDPDLSTGEYVISWIVGFQVRSVDHSDRPYQVLLRLATCYVDERVLPVDLAVGSTTHGTHLFLGTENGNLTSESYASTETNFVWVPPEDTSATFSIDDAANRIEFSLSFAAVLEETRDFVDLGGNSTLEAFHAWTSHVDEPSNACPNALARLDKVDHAMVERILPLTWYGNSPPSAENTNAATNNTTEPAGNGSADANATSASETTSMNGTAGNNTTDGNPLNETSASGEAPTTGTIVLVVAAAFSAAVIGARRRGGKGRS